MKKNMRLVAAILLLSVAPPKNLTSPQPDSLSDVFPLAIGNKWTYSLANGSYQMGYETHDVGVAVYRVVASVVAADSTRWIFSALRGFTRYTSDRGLPGPTYSMSDDGSFEIVELTSGFHELHMPKYNLTFAVFPFWRLAGDSTRFYSITSTDPSLAATLSSTVIPAADSASVSLTNVSRKSGTSLVHLVIVSSSTTSPDTIDVTIHVSPARPVTYELYQNYPNPFNSQATIAFDIPFTSYVVLRVYDVLGREVATLVNERMPQGGYERVLDGSVLGSGIYLYRIEAEGFVQTRKLPLIR